MVPSQYMSQGPHLTGLTVHTGTCESCNVYDQYSGDVTPNTYEQNIYGRSLSPNV